MNIADNSQRKLAFFTEADSAEVVNARMARKPTRGRAKSSASSSSISTRR